MKRFTKRKCKAVSDISNLCQIFYFYYLPGEVTRVVYLFVLRQFSTLPTDFGQTAERRSNYVIPKFLLM